MVGKRAWVALLVGASRTACGDAAPAGNIADTAVVADAGTGQDGTVADTDGGVDASNPEVPDAAADVAVSYKVVTGTGKVTKPSTSASYSLTLVGPMSLHVAEDGHFNLAVEAGGPVKFLSPKASFQQTQVGTKGLVAPKLTDGATALSYKITGVVPGATGKWKLSIEVKDGDGAEFEIDVVP